MSSKANEIAGTLVKLGLLTDSGDGGVEPAANVAAKTAGGVTRLVFNGAEYAAIPLDENGNAVASINHRTGLMNDLLSLAGGAGEISIPTDFPGAYIIHNGVANGASAVYSLDFALGMTTTALSATAGTFTAIPLNTASDQFGMPQGVWSDADPTKISFPGFLYANAQSRANRTKRVVISGFVRFGADVDGTVRRLQLEFENNGSGVFGAAGGQSNLGLGPINIHPGASTALPVVGPFCFDTTLTENVSAVRITAASDAGNAIDLTSMFALRIQITNPSRFSL